MAGKTAAAVAEPFQAQPFAAGVGPAPAYIPQYYYTPRKSRRLDFGVLLAQIAIIGYLTFGKSFATLGVAPVFVAEPLLAYYFLRNNAQVLNNLLSDLLKMRTVAVMVAAVFIWGMIDVIRPIFNHVEPVAVLRTSAFDYYPLFIFAGISLGKAITFEQFLKYCKVFSIFYFFYVIGFYTIGVSDFAVPWGGNPPLFMLPWNPPFAPMVVLAFWPLLKKWSWRWVVLPAALVPIVVSTGRGSFLGFGIGMVVLAVASRRHRRLMATFLISVTLILTLVGPFIHGEKGRNQNLDPYIQVCRVIATIHPNLAYNMLKQRGYDEAADDIIVARGTAEWREKIWTNCMNSLNTTELLMMGQGHGAPLVNYIPDGQDITTPHNFIIYATFYTGEVGAALFILMLLALVVAGRTIKEPHIWTLFTANILMTVMVAAVGNALETPMVAVPFYLISGLCLGMKFGPRHSTALAARHQTTGWAMTPSMTPTLAY